MRHAKAVGFAPSDRERDLEPSGRRDAAAAGAWLHANDIHPGMALVSTALRTTTTWQEVSRSLDDDVHLEPSSALYAAEPDSALDLVRATPADVDTLLVIGHNPTMGVLAQLLDDGEGDPEAMVGMLTGFPTCSLAVFDVSGDWTGVGEGTLRLTHFHVSRAD
ncbi:histidine phosphatase family protein [Nocardioides sp. JQ2195]|nr:histidine phosphatase family protein [Nocardioides sp. JQ2195]